MAKKRGFPFFYTIYFTLLIVFFVFLGLVAARISNFVKDYNKGIAETVSQEFFEDVFLARDAEKIAEMIGATTNEFETEKDAEKYIKDKLTGSLSYTSIMSEREHENRYVVKNGEENIAIFTLVEDEKGDYHPSSIEMHIPKTGGSVTVLSSSSVYVGDKKLDESYIVDRKPFKNSNLLPENVTKPEWVTYKVDGFIYEPVITASDRNGKAVSFSQDSGVPCEILVYDEQDEAICNRLVEAAKLYAKCMQNDGRKKDALAYYESGTELYEYIRTSETSFVWDHNGYDFEDVTVSEFFRYDENTVSLRISFVHVLHMNNKEDYRDIVDITFYARNIDGNYMIYNQMANVADLKES